MKIIFDLRNVGLGHNGGSLTLIKSGNALHDMGHEVYFVDSGKNQNKWEPLKPPHMRVKNNKQIPSADMIIATGYKSVGPTVKAPDRCGIKAHWIRAWEDWVFSDEQIVKKVLRRPTLKIVNSVCLHNKLLEYDCPNYIVRPGYDFEQLYPKSIRQFNPEPIIGGLYREGVHGQRKRVFWLFETVKELRKRGHKFKFWLMGSEKPPTNVDRYYRQPSAIEKNDFYNYVNIWMATSESEGLHLPPAEAMLTGCPSVGTSAELGGTQDYLIHGKTGIVTDNNLPDFVNGVEVALKNIEKFNSLSQNCINMVHEIGDRKKNMGILVSLFERLKDEL